MEVKQEVCEEEETCKIEIDSDVNDALLDGFKIEFKQEPKIEATHDTFEVADADLKKIPIKTEIGQDEHELRSLEERQTNKIEFPQETHTLEIMKMKTIHVHSSHTGGKPHKCEICFKQFSEAAVST
ncbi:uncharacterized protein LOC126886860 isoform X4 [Diabrotica virgifera virgifera]|uniref:Uncharacterized protein n=1 Tax=Diabrotica virgifera virgifera TaxID=50390 RepID=A0ABM5KIA2_DIAVI|nr:uncharacterized protein LOC126886860 isoform X4 [Diabrotica virgifera virgifera]